MQYEKNDIILEAQNVSKCFPIRGTMGRVVNHVKAVDGVSLTLRRGETYGLVGETGCGKSTLGRTLIALTPATQGSILIDGQEITAMRPGALRSLRRRVQMVFQDPYTSLDPRQRIGLARADTESRPHRLRRARLRAGRVRAVADHQLFAGSAAGARPDLPVHIARHERHPLHLQPRGRDVPRPSGGGGRHGRPVRDAAAPLYAGAALRRALRQPPTPQKQRIVLEGDLPSPINPPAGCVFHTRCPYAMGVCSQQCPAMREVMPGHRVACHLHGQPHED